MKISNNLYNNAAIKNRMQNQDVSFKGGANALVKASKEIVDYDKLLKVASNEIGDVGDKLLSKLEKSGRIVLKQADNGAKSISFKEPTIIKSFIDSATFPIRELPFLITDGALKLAKKVSGLSTSASKLYDSSFLASRRAASQVSEDMNMLQGLLETTKKLTDSASKNSGKTLDELASMKELPKKHKRRTFSKIKQVL
ncbi:MAG: hypothetical protein PHV37_06310 [Candidatus Gastranaerophilales bacterium]|nr:hypothetical protein [Candidatus Gastranaerophilales bacterium]